MNHILVQHGSVSPQPFCFETVERNRDSNRVTWWNEVPGSYGGLLFHAEYTPLLSSPSNKLTKRDVTKGVHMNIRTQVKSSINNLLTSKSVSE